jgi:hypothetical protein
VNASVTFWEATAPVKLSVRHCLCIRITDADQELKFAKGGVSWAPKLPPTLNMANPNSMSNYSKASRGLFVQPRETSIFTRLVISPSPSLRQLPSRYAIHARRNLPDKEFRYLRTVIVTAGVHPRFGSRREPLPLTFGHWPGISPYTSACALAGTCVFGKQSLGKLSLRPNLSKGQILLLTYDRFFAEFLNDGSLVHLGTLMPIHLCRFTVRFNIA